MEAVQGVSYLRRECDDPKELCSGEGASFVKKEGTLGALEILPEEILTKIFSEHVDASHVFTTFTTSQKWRRLAQDEGVWKRILEREGLIFGEKEYETYWKKPKLVPAISYLRAYLYYESPCPLFPGKKVKETQKLVLFSEEILQNLNHVGELAKSPNPGSGGIPGCFNECSWEKAFEVHGKAPLGKSFWAFVGVTVLDESRGETEDELLRRAAQYSNYGYRLHRAVERSFFNFSVQVKTEEYPDGQKPMTYSICQETVEIAPGSFVYLVAGGARAPAGLGVFYDIFLGDDSGVALLREF